MTYEEDQSLQDLDDILRIACEGFEDDAVKDCGEESIWGAAEAPQEAPPPPVDTWQADKEALLTRIDALEHRAGRALLCIDDLQEDLEELRQRWRQYLLQEQAEIVRRRKRRRKAVKCLAVGVVAAAAIAAAEPISTLGWQLFRWLAGILSIAPEAMAGFLLPLVLIWLALKGLLFVDKALTAAGDKDPEHEEVEP